MNGLYMTPPSSCTAPNRRICWGSLDRGRLNRCLLRQFYATPDRIGSGRPGNALVVSQKGEGERGRARHSRFALSPSACRGKYGRGVDQGSRMNAFAAIVFASLLSRLGYQMARSPVLPAFAADLGALPEFIGVIVAASTVTGVFFKLPSGALSDVLGRKRMMVLGALFFAAPPFLYPFVYDPWSLLALRFVHGFATAIFSPVASAYVASLAETGRGARLGWFSSANDIGATAGPLIGGFVLYFSASYPVTYLTVGALGVLTLLVVGWLPDVDRPSDRQVTTFEARAAEFREGLAEVVATPPILIAAGIEAVMYLGYGAFLGFLPIYAKTVGLNDAEIAIVLASHLATAVVVKPIGGRHSDRLGRKPVIVIGLLLCAAALPLIFRSEDFV